MDNDGILKARTDFGPEIVKFLTVQKDGSVDQIELW